MTNKDWDYIDEGIEITNKEKEVEIWNEIMKEDLHKNIYNVGIQEGRTQAEDKLNKILELFKEDSIYTGRIVKFEIRNRMNNPLDKKQKGESGK